LIRRLRGDDLRRRKARFGGFDHGLIARIVVQGIETRIRLQITQKFADDPWNRGSSMSSMAVSPL